MRKLIGLVMVLAIAAVQLGFAHAAVCRTLMAGQGAPVESHCGSMKAHTDPGCSGMAGCKDLCKRQNPAAPTTAGKSGGDDSVWLLINSFAVQCSAARAATCPSGGAVEWLLESAAFRDIDAPDAFLMHHALLI